MSTATSNDQRKSPWGVSDSLPDDFAATVLNSYFATRDDYKDGEVPLLIIEIQPENDPNAQLQEVRMGVGSGWTISDSEGKFIGHDFRELVHGRSIYGMFISAVMGLENLPRDENGDPMLNADSALNTPLCSKIWTGHTFQWKRQEATYAGLKDEKTGEDVKVSHLMPVAYIPMGNAAPVAATPAPAPVATPAPAAAEAPAAAGNAQAEALLTAFLASSADATQFIVTCLGNDTLKAAFAADKALEANVLDMSPNGYFATHKS
jgi:hypothetical protein